MDRPADLVGEILEAGRIAPRECEAHVLASELAAERRADASTGTDDEMDGVVFVSAAVKTDLPAVEIGQTVCFVSTTAATIIIDPNASDGIILEGGTRLTDGNTIENTSATADDYVCLIGDSAAGWRTMGVKGTWADGGAT